MEKDCIILSKFYKNMKNPDKKAVASNSLRISWASFVIWTIYRPNVVVQCVKIVLHIFHKRFKNTSREAKE